jgi:NitT/TauT family transport system permease protein
MGDSSALSSKRHPTVQRRRDLRTVWCWRLVIVAFIIAGWQYTPSIPGIERVFRFENPFFISSPSRVSVELWKLLFGTDGTQAIWPAVGRTIITALIGTGCAVVVGSVAGLVLSSSPKMNATFRPFLIFFNAIPRIAIIPVIIIIVGDSSLSDAVTAFTVVFFLVFYTAFEGSSSIAPEIVQNAKLLGASRSSILWKVRWPYVVGWTLGAMPNAIAFGIVGSVTAEVFTGGTGIGEYLTEALDTSNSDLTFAVVIILAVIGVALVLGSGLARSKLLPWWEGAR